MRVLFVCLGNICRSPAAEAALRALHPDWEIDSAGIGQYHLGNPPHPPMVAEARAQGLDLSTQRARQVKPADFARFDRVIAMDAPVLEILQSMRGGEMAEHFGTATGIGIDVPDPYYTGDDAGTLAVIREGVARL